MYASIMQDVYTTGKTGQIMKQILLTAMLMIALSTLPAQAAPRDIDKEHAVAVAQQRFPGRVLSVKRKGEQFHVKILNDDGDVRIIKVDADKGRKQ